MSWLRQLSLRQKLAGAWVTPRTPTAPGQDLAAPELQPVAPVYPAHFHTTECAGQKCGGPHCPPGDAPGRFYGGDGTIHTARCLDVEVHRGIVTAVWFRCQQLPFTVVDVDVARGAETRAMYSSGPIPAIVGIDLVDS